MCLKSVPETDIWFSEIDLTGRESNPRSPAESERERHIHLSSLQPKTDNNIAKLQKKVETTRRGDKDNYNL